MNKFKIFFMLFIGLALASCSETDEDTTMSDDQWTVKNNEFFTNMMTTAKQQPDKYEIIKSLTKPAESEGVPEDYIIVEKLDSVPGNYLKGHPVTGDSVRVHYEGKLYNGTVFDKSWQGEYRLDRMIPAKFVVRSSTSGSGVVPGFFTALQKMSIGDRWRVYIPAELAYGTSGSGSIRGNSVLVFDMTLHSFGF